MENVLAGKLGGEGEGREVLVVLASVVSPELNEVLEHGQVVVDDKHVKDGVAVGVLFVGVRAVG